jgi:hypothetical protein
MARLLGLPLLFCTMHLLGPTGVPVKRSARSSQGTPYTLRLQNNTWTRIRVEVRLGSTTGCDSFGSLAIYELQRDQEWEIHFDDPVICWRRDKTPGNTADGWTTWNRVQLANGENRVAAL